MMFPKDREKVAQDDVLHIRITKADKARIALAAQSDKRSTSDWARTVLLEAIERKQAVAA